MLGLCVKKFKFESCCFRVFFLGSAAIENVGSHGKPPSMSRPDDASRNSRFRCAVALRGPRFLKQLLYEGAL